MSERTTMSTTSKGDAFEERVFGSLKIELENNRLCVSPSAAKLFKKKKYHSRDRDSEIITDISLEVTLPGRDRPCLIWIFECKDYSGSVQVNDVEELHGKIQQIGEDNTKGTIVVYGAVQRGAFNYARSKGIGVVRLLPDGQIDHVLDFQTEDDLRRSRFDANEVIEALLNPGHRSKNSFFACSGDYVYGNWFSMIDKELRPYVAKG
jgi:hypothetical protein